MKTQSSWNLDTRVVTRDGVTLSNSGTWCDCELCELMDEFEQIPERAPHNPNRQITREINRRRRKQIRRIYRRYSAAAREANAREPNAREPNAREPNAREARQS